MNKLTSKQFIEKALEIHGNKYDYSMVEYKNNQSKIIIICQYHGEFYQTPCAHLRSQGCPKCGYKKISNSKTHTFEQFKKKADVIHKKIYDYSEILYKNKKEKIFIKCRKHGFFTQRPSAHLLGEGCPKCGKIESDKKQRRLSFDEFVERAIILHKKRYTYEKTDIINYKTFIAITCKKHGNFKQSVQSHLGGSGCSKCAKHGVLISTKDFIEKAEKVHGNRYDYSEIDYRHSLKKIIIGCSIHGNFYQAPYHHISGANCPKCAISSKAQSLTLTTNQFIERSNKVHDNKYSYSKTVYLNAKSKVIIICPKHGEFKMRSSTHLEGQGCPVCRKSKGELKIECWLKANQISYISQAAFSDCRGKKYPLRFDFYLPKFNVCIEFDGPQHYEKSSYFIKDSKLIDIKFAETQLYDEIKNKYCSEHNIKLIRITRDHIRYNPEKFLNYVLLNHKTNSEKKCA